MTKTKKIMAVLVIASVTMLFTACVNVPAHSSDDGITTIADTTAKATVDSIVDTTAKTTDDSIVDTTAKTTDDPIVDTTADTTDDPIVDTTAADTTAFTDAETKYYENPELFTEVWAGEDIIPISISGDVILKEIVIYDKKESNEPDSYEVGYLILKLKGNSKDFSISFEDDIELSVDLGFTFIHCEDSKYEIAENNGMFAVYGFKPDQKEIEFSNREIVPILEVNYEGKKIQIANIICYFE